MNHASSCNCRRNLLIGLLAAIAPLCALHAADDSEQWRQDQTIDASPPAMPAERSDMGTTTGSTPSQYDRDRAPSTTDTPRGAQGPIRSDIGEQPSEYSRGVPFRSRSDRMRLRDDERRRQDERNRAMPESTYPAYPPGRPDSPTP